MSPSDVRERPAVPIDPRIRARRISIRRDEGRRRLRRIGCALGVVAVAGAVWALTLSAVLDVDRVDVVGSVRTPAEAIVRATGVERGDPLLHADLGAAEDSVARLPWVANATVRRRWPGTLEVTVTERDPVAVAATEKGSWAVVDRAGRVLEVAAAAEPGLPLLRGVPPAPAPGATLADSAAVLELVVQLPAPVAALTTEVQVGDSDLRLVLEAPAAGPAVQDGGVAGTMGDGAVAGTVVVRLGSADSLADKLLAVVTMLDETEEPLEDVVLDVRVPTAPVVTTLALTAEGSAA